MKKLKLGSKILPKKPLPPEHYLTRVQPSNDEMQTKPMLVPEKLGQRLTGISMMSKLHQMVPE